MIKKSINPFAIMYGIAVLIGFSLANIFLRRNLVNQVQLLRNKVELLESERTELYENFQESVREYVFEEMEVEDIMKIVSKIRGFECSCIDREVLKKLLNGENPEENDLSM